MTFIFAEFRYIFFFIFIRNCADTDRCTRLRDCVSAPARDRVIA